MRLAIISDIHEDYRNLKKILRKAALNGYDQMVCLGDISGFSHLHYSYEKHRDAHACLSMLREKSAIIVPGNHDYHAAKRIPAHCQVFDFPENWYELSPEKQSALAKEQIWLHEDDIPTSYTEDDLLYLNSLPEYYIIKGKEQNLLFSHYVFPNLAGFKKGFYHTKNDFIRHFEFMQKQDCGISFTGHAHISGAYLVSREKFRHYSYRRIKLKSFPVCIGIPPVTRNHNRSGFCIFDSKKFFIRPVRCL
jgi:predicted phosphodiesterase